MNLNSAKMPDTPKNQSKVTKKHHWLFSWLGAWELYPILFITIFLRLYRIDTTWFNEDHAAVFRMAHDAFAYGLWPITSNRASIGNLNFPLVIYIFMLPAFFSANPLWGEVLVALFNIAAVVLAYIFTRRYFGRLAAALASLLYAASVVALAYSADIWPQNLLPPFVMLFMICLFRGVVDRRRGWLFPALIILGIMYQIHGSSLLLSLPLGIAFVLAYRTIRWREIIFAAIVILILASPFLYWQLQNNFGDFKIILGASSKGSAHFDLYTFKYYKLFLSPVLQSEVLRGSGDNLPTYPTSVLINTPLHYLRRFLWLDDYVLVPLVFFSSILYAGFEVLHSKQPIASNGFKGRSWAWIKEFWTSYHRQGLALLLVWQIILPLALFRHAIPLFAHYYIIYLPGQFILMGVFLAKSIENLRQYQLARHKIARFALIAITIIVLGSQLIGSTAALIDNVQGNFDGKRVFPSFNDLSSLQHTLNEADQVAQEHHIHHIYISVTYTTNTAMRYLAEQLKTPTTIFDIWHCAILPGPETGPVVYIASPESAVEETLLKQYTNATLIDQPKRLGGAPFKLYVLSSKAEPTADHVLTYTSGVKALNTQATILENRAANMSWLSTRWQVQDSVQPDVRKMYFYKFDMAPNGQKQQNGDPIECMATNFNKGDQLITYQSIAPGTQIPTYLTIKSYSFSNGPVIKRLGSLRLTTFDNEGSPWQTLQTQEGKTMVNLPVLKQQQ